MQIIICFLLTFYLSISGIYAQQDTTKTKLAQWLDFSNGKPATNFLDAMISGRITLAARARAWISDDDAFQTAYANTIGTNLGYMTQKYKGFQLYTEVENTFSFDPSLYNDLLGDNPERSIVVDPEVTEFNSLWLSYDKNIGNGNIWIKLGRHRVALEDERFIGAVNGRQDDQTFDGVAIKYETDKFVTEYAYVNKVNRIYADVQNWDSNSHIAGAAYKLAKNGRLAAFFHLLDFQGDADLNNSQTYGLTFDRYDLPRDRIALDYQFGFAYQMDYADNPIDYALPWLNFELGLFTPAIGKFTLGYELAGSDDGKAGFKFPLSTGQRLHRFSDKFIDTPDFGVQNYQLLFEPKPLPFGFFAWTAYHLYYSQEGGDFLAQEIDFFLGCSLAKNLVTIALQFGTFFAEDQRYTDISIFAVDIDFKIQ